MKKYQYFNGHFITANGELIIESNLGVAIARDKLSILCHGSLRDTATSARNIRDTMIMEGSKETAESIMVLNLGRGEQAAIILNLILDYPGYLEKYLKENNITFSHDKVLVI